MVNELDIVNHDSLIADFNTGQAMIRAKEAVSTVMKVIANRPEPLIIKGKQYMEYQDWRLLALYFGITTQIDNVTEINEMHDYADPNTGCNGQRMKFIGFTVDASTLRDGKVLTTSSAECTRYEANWLKKDRFQLREMATIRAKRSALKDVLRWVFSMASLEMPELNDLEVDKDLDEGERLF